MLYRLALLISIWCVPASAGGTSLESVPSIGPPSEIPAGVGRLRPEKCASDTPLF